MLHHRYRILLTYLQMCTYFMLYQSAQTAHVLILGVYHIHVYRGGARASLGLQREAILDYSDALSLAVSKGTP
jgi:hypothetical protein